MKNPNDSAQDLCQAIDLVFFGAFNRLNATVAGELDRDLVIVHFRELIQTDQQGPMSDASRRSFGEHELSSLSLPTIQA
jgi:hypothetical protein